MERLWSPWRMEYIEASKDTPDDDRVCVFCALLAGDLTDQPAPLRVEELAFVSLAKYPYNPGHLVILPTRHTGELEDLRAEELTAIDGLLQRSVRALREASDPHGFNVGLNLGRVAGAGIPEHLHWHVVPRWGGDTNFMPVIGQTRVLPQLLEDTFEKLKPAFEASAP
jgi:ATP adenylyltransferase